MYLRFILPLVILITLGSCSSNPEIADVEQNLKERIASESENRIEVVSIEKTDAAEKENFGQKIYTISYKVKIRFKQDCFMYINKSGVGPFIESFKTYLEEPDFVPSMQMQVVSCPKGQEVVYESSSSFSETEEGWSHNKP
jgi:hypothetical protein